MADLMNSNVLSSLLQTPPYGQVPDAGGVPALSGIREIDRPIEERLKYNTSFHAEMLSRLNARQMLAERNIAHRMDDWNRVDEHCQLYVNLARNVRKGNKTSGTKKEMPWERSIVVPMSYSILQTILTQCMAIFTRRDPIIEIMGVGPEDIKPAKIMQAVLAYDQQQTNFLVQLYSLLQDAVKYGLGIWYDCWEETYGWKFTKRAPNPMLDFLGVPEVERSWDVLKQHNMVETIDPRLVWLDPRVSVANGQKAEFAGHRVFCSYLDILERSQANGGPYFNVEYVAKLGAGGIARRDTTIARALKHLMMTGTMDEKDKGFHGKDCMNVRLIPKDWKLGDGERPEIWQFAWVDKTVIIRAHQSEYHHQELPYAGAESNVDTHVTFNPGLIENLDGMQRFMDWGYNSHWQNIIRHLNNSMIYSPTLVEELDILNPTAAGHYRLSAIGEKLLQEGRITMDGVLHQLMKTDVTGGMLPEVRFQYDMGMRMTGASDAMQAQLSMDKRTATEINQTNLGGSARMSFYTTLMDAMAMAPTSKRMISNRQQFSDIPQYVRISGELMREAGGERLLVSPSDLAGNFDYVARSGTMSPDPAEMVQSWEKVGEMLAKAYPVLSMMPDAMGRVPDLHEFFKEGVRAVGIRNVDSLYKPFQPVLPPPVQVMDDQKVEEQKRQGNVIPLRQAGAV